MDPRNRKNVYQNYSYRPLRSSAKPGPRPSRPHNSRHWLRKLITVAIVLAVVVAGAYYFMHRDKTTTKQPVGNATFNQTPKAVISAPSPNITTMANSINAVISNNSDIDMSVSLVDLNDNQAQHYGDSSAFTAASTTKVITAADFLHQVEDGQESLTETINGNSAEYEIQQMIVVSDDNAWDALNNELGYSQLQAYANSIGLSSFQSIPNTVTSDDMALLLEKLYKGQLLDASYTQLLLSYMKQANYREYIVPAVPSNDTIYHKIGLYEDNVHDEAIITDGSKAFVIVIFTNGNGAYNWTARAQMMQQITKAALAAYF